MIANHHIGGFNFLTIYRSNIISNTRNIPKKIGLENRLENKLSGLKNVKSTCGNSGLHPATNGIHRYYRGSMNS